MADYDFNHDVSPSTKPIFKPVPKGNPAIGVRNRLVEKGTIYYLTATADRLEAIKEASGELFYRLPKKVMARPSNNQPGYMAVSGENMLGGLRHPYWMLEDIFKALYVSEKPKRQARAANPSNQPAGAH